MIDTNNYYPFGLNHISGAFSTSNFGIFYSYKYNGKELQESGMYDYGARMYMPDLGRWGVIDPLAEKSRRWSTYTYAYDNPVMFIDPDGRQNVSASQREHDSSLFWRFDQNTTIYGSGWFEGSYEMAGFNNNFKTMWNGGDPGGSGSIAFGKTAAYKDLLLALKNGGDFSLSSNNGYMSWWTGGALGDANTAQEMIGHMMKLSNSQQDSSVGVYSPLSQGNTLLSFNGVYMSNLPYRRYIGTARRNVPFTYRGIKYYGNGRTFLKSESLINVKSLIKAGKFLGPITVGLGIVLDYGYGVKEYERDPNSPNAVHPRKADLNTIMGLYGLTGVGTVPALLYFGVDSFYPGGWEGYGNNYQSIQSENASIVSGFITAPYGSQKF
ncbi:RHS repeat-associated core domain-containing protein [Chryseobacterium sp. PCH239]|uniref:RHS repeat-associated core domain-containing protein n=1 Tax=Chryseobacterium sp. PCH239 TaxID=2825845 RepID=UPI001C1279DB|nr:RHS repeat-associated core domain-containing protein [Chryseobacterium sp. PCH239]